VELLQTAFMLVLVGVLVASVVSVGIMALMQIARTRRLAREAETLGMRFAAEDPSDLPRRYADFTLINHGHSPQASNVMFGRVLGRRVRAFDFRCELGHGPRRVTRHYDVVVVETDSSLPESILWHHGDEEYAPLPVRGDERIGDGFTRGDEAVARLLEGHEALSGTGKSVQVCGTALMLFAPEVSRKEGYTRRIREAVALADGLDPPPEGGPAGEA